MRLIHLAIAALVLLGPVLAASDDEDGIGSEEFTLYVGEGVKIGDYRVELIDVTSVKDGLIEVKVWKRGSDFEDWRVLEESRDADFDEGAEDGGITLTPTEIYDKNSVKLRAEFNEDLGYPRKYITEKALAPVNAPDLIIEKSFEPNELNSGDEVKVTIAVKNVGNDTAFKIEVHDQPPLSQFVYIAGYPPKIKSQLDPGESDSTVYIMDSVKDGTIKVPPIVVTYSDSKENIRSNSSESFTVVINPKRKPSLELEGDPVDPVKYGGLGHINMSVNNSGEATAYRVEVQSEIKPPGGLEIISEGFGENCDGKMCFQIDPNISENYSMEFKGLMSGNYTVTLKTSYQSGDEVMLKEKSFDVIVLGREYKYLYYLPVIPIALALIWVIKRYREYKY